MVRIKAVATDSIYTNNTNCKFYTHYGISASFVRKGRAAKNEKAHRKLRSVLSCERVTRLDGSFGTER